MSGWSVRLRATVTVTVIVAAALGVAAAVLIGVLRTSLVTGTADEAGRRADQVATLIAAPAAPLGPVTSAEPARPLGPLVVNEEAAPVTGVRTDPSAGTLVITGEPGGAARAPAAGSTGVTGAGQPVNAAEAPPTGGTIAITDPNVVVGHFDPALPVGTVAAGDGYVTATRALDATTAVSVRASLGPTQVALETLTWVLAVGIPLLLAMVAALTWFSVGRALAPVAAIRAKLADITARDLHQRVPEPKARDEIAALATTVNGTLDRLETAVGLHKRFVADAAHELRSPIATLRTRLEIGERDAPALAKESLTDVTRLQSLAADLLVLARLDAGEPLRLQEVDLGQLATEEALRCPAPIELDVAPGVVVQGSPAQLTRVITNLIANAVRHRSSSVSVRVAPGPVLEVLDDGPGIPEEHRETVFHRFTRLDEARDRDAGGAGLGLAIAREIVAAHGGTLTIEDSPRGALFRMTLP
ncbi:HAMP domain-containing protein [Herbidospora sp. NEAU-GS84]|uniref:histidine kinase n=1 Tax=Herbidospora solisilvae TaxID=2696284 RepID=A0A7C9JBM0_9ACTN|nr:HAMP domain-containing sensor histidine kinase [Herbidospora solisilvae]NAS21961.1 HAMP domain-containing protein [Herbidospora solisilvae]